MNITKQEALDKIEELKKYIENYKEHTLNNLNSIEDAEFILKNCREHIKYNEHEFCREKDWITYQLETIIKATNYIDNGYKLWIINFNNNNESKYYSFWKKQINGWSLSGVGYYFSSSIGVVGYFIKEDSCKTISNKFKDLYIQYLNFY